MRSLVSIALAVALGTWTQGAQQPAPAPKPAVSFAALSAALSEPGGDFGSDNLTSNEQSYLRVLPALTRAGVSVGAYIGVGPDQNLSYIAHIKPAVAFIIDIRRDNLLLHLLFKAIFTIAPTRIEYLCALTGRAPPPRPETWATASIEKLISHVDPTPALSAVDQRALRVRLENAIKASIDLRPGDLARIDEFHREFIDAGLSLMFAARGRPPSNYYPSLRDLLLENDGAGRRAGFLAIESGYQFLRGMQQRDLIVPVVGDVSGSHAMGAIAAEMKTRGTPLSALYVSNVEQYLYQDGRFPAFVENLKRFPRTERSTIIRSVFPSGYRGPLPQSSQDSYSTSLTQNVGVMLLDAGAGRYRYYSDLVLASSKSPASKD